MGATSWNQEKMAVDDLKRALLYKHFVVATTVSQWFKSSGFYQIHTKALLAWLCSSVQCCGFTNTYWLQEDTLNLIGTIIYRVSHELISGGECFSRIILFLLNSKYIFCFPLHFHLTVMDGTGRSPTPFHLPCVRFLYKSFTLWVCVHAKHSCLAVVPNKGELIHCKTMWW